MVDGGDKGEGRSSRWVMSGIRPYSRMPAGGGIEINTEAEAIESQRVAKGRETELKKVNEKMPVLSEVLNEAGIASIPRATPVAAPTTPPSAATCDRTADQRRGWPRKRA